MSNKNRYKGLVCEQNLDFWLSSTGNLFPRNEVELDTFEKLFENYESRLKGITIDAMSIINCKMKSKEKTNFDELSIPFQDIQSLKMAARKGNEIPDEILRKIINKHK